MKKGEHPTLISALCYKCVKKSCLGASTSCFFCQMGKFCIDQAPDSRFQKLDRMSKETPITYHVLGASDIALMRGLLDLYGIVFEMPEEYHHNQPDDAYLHTLLARDSFISMIAKADGKIIGGFSGYILHKFEQDRREVYIYDLAVDENWRRQGVATGLLNAMRQEARARDIYVIIIEAEEGDEAPNALYRKMGSEEIAHHYNILP